MIRLTSSLALTALLLTCGASAFAEDAKEKPADLFGTLDKNGDGTLVADEISEAQQKAFGRLLRVGDADKDGKLTKAEYLKGLKPDDPVELKQSDLGGVGQRGGRQRPDLGRLFEMSDKDGDGKIALKDLPEQIQGRLKPLFERIGKDEITIEDIENVRRQQGGRPEQMKRPGQGAGTDRPQMALVRLLDEDGNGQLSKSELKQLAEKFSELDRNGDGQLGVGELTGFTGPMMARSDSSRPEARRDGDSTKKKRPGRPDGSSNKPRPDQKGSPGQDGKRLEQFFEQNDKDGDGSISRDEAPERLGDRFDRVDANGDDKLSKEELQQAFARRNRQSDSK